MDGDGRKVHSAGLGMVMLTIPRWMVVQGEKGKLIAFRERIFAGCGERAGEEGELDDVRRGE